MGTPIEHSSDPDPGDDCKADVPSPTCTLVHINTVATSLDFLRGQIRHLVSEGYQVHVVAAPAGDAMTRFAAVEGATAHEVPMTRTMAPLRDLLSLYRVWRLLGKLNPTIVHAGTPKGGFLGMVAASLRHVPVRIYHMHGIRGMTARGWRRRVLMTTEWLACRLSTRVLCVSASTRDTAIAAGLCAAAKTVVLAAGSCNGVDATGRFDPGRIDDQHRAQLRTALEIPMGAPIIGFVGRVVRDKGIVELEQAWVRLASNFASLHLLIIGTIEPDDPVPASALEALRRHPRVRFVAAVPDPAAHYALMDVVVLPTYREGLPTVVLEAAAMRIPVVATRVPGCVDAITEGVTGTLVPPYSGVALATAVATYLQQPELRRQHGAAGRTRMLSDFTPRRIWEGVVDLYRAELRAWRQQ